MNEIKITPDYIVDYVKYYKLHSTFSLILVIVNMIILLLSFYLLHSMFLIISSFTAICVTLFTYGVVFFSTAKRKNSVHIEVR